ncbi:MAG: methylmalonyl-CoA mutase family protein [Planctomycetota bacterium]
MNPVVTQHKVRFITAASLFDGHDASINIMRRLLQRLGAEVIHLGHNRSVAEVLKAAIEEDVQGIAISSYQGGHNEYFKYLLDELRRTGHGHVKVFGGGGGVILPQEIKDLEDYGVTRIFSPEDGRKMGLEGMIRSMITTCDFAVPSNGKPLKPTKPFKAPVVGITGTGGAGKSSLTDELILRFRESFPSKRFLAICLDPTQVKTGGALLGDRIRMNAIDGENIVVRSLSASGLKGPISDSAKAEVEKGQQQGFDLIFVETPGIGQGDTPLVGLADIHLYVMTSEFGAPTQLEKISMLDFADLVAINKFERPGSLDALREVTRAIRRNKGQASMDPRGTDPAASGVHGTCAARFNDPGVTALFQALIGKLTEKAYGTETWKIPNAKESKLMGDPRSFLPPDRQRYLSDIAKTLRDYKSWVRDQADLVRRIQALETAAIECPKTSAELTKAAKALLGKVHPDVISLWRSRKDFEAEWSGQEYVYKVRDKEIRQPLVQATLSGTPLRRISLPMLHDAGDFITWRLLENVPGSFPYTGGAFPLKRPEEEPARMFAGEGDPARTNERFHLLSRGQSAKRLSTAFDSVTLYGEDPDRRPDIYGKVGESGVSICTVENMERLYAGFDLCAPNTSVSMTINGPAPVILAFFMNAATRQQCRLHLIRSGKLQLPEEKAFHPEEGEKSWQDTRQLLSDEEFQSIREKTVQAVRGTVQADILKEDQAQNTCIFGTEFALRLMTDIQAWFIEHKVRNYYSVSISGYHIAEAGANPITQLAFTLANGFTYVESYLARGMKIDDFAPNLSFFFSNGLDAEYQVIGRVARRIWAVALSRLYGANERSQKLKYHIQTSGRSLHAQEIDFNDIRTTLQALMAVYDHCNSLHTNAYDEAITTPTAESVRRALAIQMIINRELGTARGENILQGSAFIAELTELVEEAVLSEFDRLTARGGVLGAMELQYQRSKIQEESLLYETLKHSGELPIIGVNTFLNPSGGMASEKGSMTVARATTAEKEGQIAHLQSFHTRHKNQASSCKSRLTEAARQGGNMFDVLMDVVEHLSLGQVTRTLYDIGGKYRRNL